MRRLLAVVLALTLVPSPASASVLNSWLFPESDLGASNIVSGWFPSEFVFDKETVLEDVKSGAVTATDGTGQPSSVWASSWQSRSPSVDLFMGPTPGELPAVFVEVSQWIVVDSAPPVDGVGGLVLAGSYSGVTYGALYARFATLTPATSNLSLNRTGGTLRDLGALTNSRQVTELTQFASQVFVAVPIPDTTEFLIYSFAGVNHRGANSGSYVYEYPQLTGDMGDLATLIDSVQFSAPNGFSAWKSSGSYVKYVWSAKYVYGAGYSFLTVSDANALVGRLRGHESEDLGSVTATSTVGSIDSSQTVGPEGPSVDGDASDWLSWAEGLLRPLEAFLPWLSYFSELGG